MIKERIINQIIRVEGGYVNDPLDSGGETNYGITEGAARLYGYGGPMCDMPRAVAFEIYSARYWDALKADRLVELSEGVAEEVVDAAVNMGPGRAANFLQRALNVLNKQSRLYADLKTDGIIGGRTLEALEVYLINRSERVLLVALNCLQGAAYIKLAECRAKDEKFIYGWLKNRVVL